MVVAHRHWADAELMTIDKRQMCVCAKINNGVECQQKEVAEKGGIGQGEAQNMMGWCKVNDNQMEDG